MSPDTPQPQDDLVERCRDLVLDTYFGSSNSENAKHNAKYVEQMVRDLIPLIAADVQQRIAVALDQRKGDPRYGAALFVQRLDLNLSEASR